MGGGVKERGLLWEGRGEAHLESLSPWMGCTHVQEIGYLPIQLINCNGLRVRGLDLGYGWCLEWEAEVEK